MVVPVSSISKTQLSITELLTEMKGYSLLLKQQRPFLVPYLVFVVINKIQD